MTNMDENAIDHGARAPAPARIASITFIDASGERRKVFPTRELGRELTPSDMVRRIPRYEGALNTPGRLWSRKMARLVDYESWLEAKYLLLLDRDAEVESFCTQPLTVTGSDADGTMNHTVDIMARRVGGDVDLIDVKALPWLEDRETIRHANLAHGAADRLGWTYYLVGVPPEPMHSNIAWLAGYRRLAGGHELREPILHVAERPIRLRELWRLVGPAELSKVVAWHLLWHGELDMDYGAPLNEDTLVWRTR